MREVYIIEAVRTPIGRRGGALSTLHPGDLLGHVQRAAIDRSGVDPGAIGQVIGGCVSQVGEQSFNLARTAWLSQGLPLEVPSTTIDSQCGSSQQATTLSAGLVGSGLEDLVLACGVEMMTRVPLGANMQGGSPIPPSYGEHYAFKTQFQGAEMIGEEFGLAREETDRFGLRSQELANRAWSLDRRHGYVRGERGVRIGRARVDEGVWPGRGAGESERRRDRDRSSHGLHGRTAHHDRPARARASRGALRPDRDVLRRWPRYRNDHRAGVATDYERISRSTASSVAAL